MLRLRLLSALAALLLAASACSASAEPGNRVPVLIPPATLEAP